MMVNAWSYNFDSGTSTAFLYDSAVEAGQKDQNIMEQLEQKFDIAILTNLFSSLSDIINKSRRVV